MASEFASSDSFEEPSISPPPVPAQHKPWLELRQAVWRTRKLATSLVSRVPHSFTFRHIKTEVGRRTRLYFLGVPSGHRENTLQFIDIPSSDTTIWEPLLETFNATPAHGQFSKEEQLMRERKRLGSFGITSYDYNEHAGKFVFNACNSLFHCSDTLRENPVGFLESQPLTVHEAKSSCTKTRLDAKMCPHNPELLAYISASDIWVTNTTTGHECRLTFAHLDKCSLSEDPLSAGVPSFVVQEEFDRYTGYWWQPVPTHAPGEPVTYRILYELVDESDVEILRIASSSGDSSSIDEYRYPRAGSANASCTVKMLEFQLSPNGDIENVIRLDLCDELKVLFPWMEYIPRAGWTPDGKYIYVQLLDRQQLQLQLALLPLSNFKATSERMDTSGEVSGSETLLSPQPTVHVIYNDTSTVWVNVDDILHFFPQENPSEISFLWLCQQSGYRHLYHVTSRLASHTAPVPRPDAQQNGMQFDAFEPHIVKRVALTSGDWEVLGKQIWVDEARKLVYFLGLKDSPLEPHLYFVSYENPGDIVRLTELGSSHAVSLDKECSMFVSVYSCISQPPSSRLFRIVHSPEGHVQAQPVGPLSEGPALSEDYRPPQLFQYENSDGITMYGMMYQPHNYEPGQKYPAVMFVYGGPQVQLVTNSYKSMRFLRLHTLASLGHAVIVIDSRGSVNRGLNFESHIKNRLGQVEIADQVEGLHWLAQKVDYIDLNRVAIHGWSYGGYLSLLGLCQRSDVFKVAIAGAPVTSWTLYDTGYTERYMNTPQGNPEGYRAGSVLELVKQFPSEGNRLLIVHGLIDENVHFFHTSQLINALVKACKPYQLQLYPNERHGIRNPDASEHYETNVLNFLQQNL